MLRWVEVALKNRLWVLVAFLALALLGVYSALHLPIDAVPDITNVQVVVNTHTGALDPEQIERTVTYYVELEMSGLPQLEEIRSLSKYGLSQVTVVFREGTNIYWARQQVTERLGAAREQMPGSLNPELGPITTGLGEVIMYVVEPVEGSDLAKKAEKERLLYLRTIQDYVIRPELRKVHGLADVDSNGGYKKEIHVNIVPERLEANAISLEELYLVLNTLGENFGGGFIERKGKQLIVRTTDQMQNLEDVSRVPVKIRYDGSIIYLGQIADVREDHALRVGAATYRGHETVLGTGLMRVGENSRAVALQCENVLKNLKLPDGVQIKILYSRSSLVSATIQTVLKNLSEGAILVIAVLFLILGRARAAILVALAIPFSMLVALSGMHGLGISANLMSLGAIDFGLLVDASVVMIENYLRHAEEHSGAPLTLDKRISLITESAREVVKPVVTGLFIIMLVYVPVLALEGVEGKMFRPMAQTVLMALGASLLAAIFLMPVLTFYVLHKEKTKPKEPWLTRMLLKAYKPALEFSLKHRRALALPALLFTAFSLFIFMRLGSDFMPQLNEGDLVVMAARDSSTGIKESVRVQMLVDELIASQKEVAEVFARIGTPESATDPMGPNLADTFVILKKEHSDVQTKQKLYDRLHALLNEKFPEQQLSQTQPIEMRFNEILEGSRADVTLRIFGDDLKTLMEFSDRATKLIREIRGTYSVELDALTALKESPILDIKADKKTMARFGVSLAEVNRALEMAMSGIRVGSYYDNNIRLPVVVHLDESRRNNLKQIEQIPVGLATGGTIPLGKLTQIDERKKVTTIARYYGRRYAAIGIYLKNRDIASFVEEAKEKIQTGLELPFGYTTEWAGQFKNLQKARQRLLLIVPVTLGIIFLLLLRSFNSLRDALLIFLSVPFAMSGGVLSLWIAGLPFSIPAAIGFIALSGIAILNAMVMVSFFHELFKKNHDTLWVVREGALERLRPVAMTALVASLGFLPMALATGLGSEVQRPLATVVVGGLITTTVLTLLLLPAFYLWSSKEAPPTLAVEPSLPKRRQSKKS